MAVYRETLYRGHRVWKTRLETGQAIASTTKESAVLKLARDIVFKGSQITDAGQRVVSPDLVQVSTSVSFYGCRDGSTENYSRSPKVSTVYFYGNAINSLPPVVGPRSTVAYRLRYKK